MRKRISLIIPTLNEADRIEHLLRDIDRQTLQPFEIIIVDGSSQDKTKEIVRKYKNILILTLPPNVAEQRNMGGYKAKGDILFFLDADVRLNKNFLESSLQTFNKKKFDIACPFYLPFKSSFMINLIYSFFNMLFFLGQNVMPSGAGSCIIIKRNVFGKMKGFNKELVFDDIELIRRTSYQFRFGMIGQKVYVSDRRFRKEGNIKTFIKYLLLSYYFFTGNFKEANKIQYKFGHYSER